MVKIVVVLPVRKYQLSASAKRALTILENTGVIENYFYFNGQLCISMEVEKLV